MAAEIYQVHRELVSDVWAELAKPIATAMRYHEIMDADDLRALVERGDILMLAAVVEDEIIGALFLEVIQFPRSRCLNVIVLAGKRGKTRSWFGEIDDKLQELGRRWECDQVIAMGRRGWMIAKQYGWKAEPRTILMKDIDDGDRQGRRRRQGDGEPLETRTTVL